MAQGDFTIELEPQDMQELDKKLAALTDLEQKAAIKKGLQEGTKVFVNEGRKNLRRTLSKEPINVASREKKRAKGGYPPLSSTFTTKVKTKKAAAGYSGFRRPGGNVAHLIDKGTVQRFTKTRAYRGSVSKGSPRQGSFFWTNTVNSKAYQALQTLLDSVEKTIFAIIQSNK